MAPGPRARREASGAAGGALLGGLRAAGLPDEILAAFAEIG